VTTAGTAGPPMAHASAAFAPAERFLDCVHCGLCLAACPTYVENGLEADSPRGRIYLMRSLQEGRLAATAETVRHLDLCLGCRACETACPSGVRYGELIEAARTFVEARYRRPWPARLQRAALARLFPSPRGRRWLARAAALTPRGVLAALARARPLPAAVRYRVALAAALPRPEPGALPAVIEPDGHQRGTVGLLTGCIADTFFGGTNRAAAGLLARAGFRVVVPRDQTCCGAVLLHLGQHDATVAFARRNVAVFAAAGADVVATTAAGCGAMLRGYGALLADEPDAVAAAALAARARDVTEILAAAGLPAPGRRLDRRVTYHDACHLAHAQGVRSAPRDLLRQIPGVELVELAESDHCCGSAGTYNLTEPAMARRLLARKVDHVLATGAAVVATANPGCALQLRAGLLLRGAGLAVAHPVDLLARAYA
jgi:glycolate oxidase iron-sulfur subunit